MTTSKTAADLAADAEAREDIRRLRRRWYPLNDELSEKVASIANQCGILGVIENPHSVAAHAAPGHDESKPGLTFSMHIPEGALQQARDGASSASVSLEEFIGECVLAGTYRGYR